MAVSEDLVRKLAVLSVGRAPRFSAQGITRFATLPPETTNDLISLALDDAGGFAALAAFEVLLRENARYRTARAQILTFDATTDYTVTINGNAYTTNGDTDIETTTDLVVTDINGGETGTGTETISGRAIVDIGTFDAATTYTVTLDSIAHATVGAANEAAAIAALVTAINTGVLRDKILATHANPSPGVDRLQLDNRSNETYTVAVSAAGGTGTITFVLRPVTASRESSGSSSVLKIVGTGGPDYTIALSQATGTGRWDYLQADATAVSFVLWGVGVGRTTPVKLSDEVFSVTENMTERARVAGLTHLGIQITDTDGLVRRHIGPCDLE